MRGSPVLRTLELEGAPQERGRRREAEDRVHQRSHRQYANRRQHGMGRAPRPAQARIDQRQAHASKRNH